LNQLVKLFVTIHVTPVKPEQLTCVLLAGKTELENPVVHALMDTMKMQKNA